MAKEYDVKMFSPRWGHPDPYKFRWNSSGWDVESGGHQRLGLDPDGTHNGQNEVIDMMRNDSIYPPVVIDTALAYIWDQVDQGVSDNDIQNAFASLAQWIDSVSKTKPTDAFWHPAF